MSVYSVKGKGWRYDFTLKGARHTEAWFKTKAKAKRAEAQKREELANPNQTVLADQEGATSTGMAFLELVNMRLDHVKEHNSARHYEETRYMARRWVTKWGSKAATEVTRSNLESYIKARRKVSAYSANKEIRYLRSAFNFAIKKGLLDENPTRGIEFYPVEKKLKYVPAPQDIERIINMAGQETQDYLYVLRDTMARVSEVNRLTWDDIDFGRNLVVLYTRKKRGGHLTPRSIPMTEGLQGILTRRYESRDKSKPWVFWHRYWDKKTKGWIEGPYNKRKDLMRNLCKRAGVRAFGFHALRHAGASVLDSQGVPIGTIQRLLGHENRSTTEIYLHSIGQPEREAITLLERAIGGGGEKPHTESHTAHRSESHTKAEKGMHLKLVKG